MYCVELRLEYLRLRAAKMYSFYACNILFIKYIIIYNNCCFPQLILYSIDSKMPKNTSKNLCKITIEKPLTNWHKCGII